MRKAIENIRMQVSDIGRLIMLSLMLLSQLPTDAASVYKTFELTFSEDDFTWSVNADGEMEIESRQDFIYPESDEPAIPLFSRDIAIDGKYAFKSVSVSFQKREIKDKVRLASAPIPVTTDWNQGIVSASARSYDMTQQFPADNCKYVATSKWGDVNVLHFQTTPFIYDAAEQKVYFIDSIKLSVRLEAATSVASRPLNNLGSDIIKSFVINPESVDDLMAKMPESYSLDLEDRIDYVVITNRELSSSFKPLCQWKTEKGYYSKIITIEDITDSYEGNDTQLKIKKCLYDLYLNHGLKYVLLGGDDYIVPVKGCYGYVSGARGDIEDYAIPTDMYYGCFDGCFEWDDNGDGVYGQYKDNMDYTQSIYITRLPVSHASDVEAFTHKLLEYEKNPIFNSNILMCGVSLFDTEEPTQSDAEIKGEMLYTEYIAPYWNGSRYRFYDTATDFNGGTKYNVTSENLRSQFERGYSFVDIITHGLQTSWSMEEGKAYDISLGKAQYNQAQTIVTTMACFTNAFDSSVWGTSDPCLSESLIRNGNSGVIAYLGCSRYGIDYRGHKLGPSLIYNRDFYKLLFSESIEGRSFGALVAAVKASNATSSYSNTAMRWLQYGLNPIGDPEMPIWISEPKKFKNVSVLTDGISVNINSGEGQCRICIVDEWDHGEGYFNVFENVREVNVSDLPEESSICITKSGYIPKQYKVTVIQNKTVSGNRSYANDVLLCGSSITSEMKQGPFIIKEGRAKMTAGIVVLGPGTMIEKGAELFVNSKQ